jgi:hypothetical protein
MRADGRTPEELKAETATALPDKEVVSILDLNADVDVFIDAAASADVLSDGSTAASSVDQGDAPDDGSTSGGTASP